MGSSCGKSIDMPDRVIATKCPQCNSENRFVWRRDDKPIHEVFLSELLGEKIDIRQREDEPRNGNDSENNR